MRTNYILIDYENTQPETVPFVEGVPVKVLIFVGAKQPVLPTKFVTSVHALGSDAEHIQIESTGKNALDFHIACFIGKLAEKDSNSSFNIVAKDQGYDPLIKYLRKKKIPARRVEQLSEVPVFRNTFQRTLGDKARGIENSLKTRVISRPRKVEALENTINTYFGRSLEDEEIKKIIALLQSRGTVTVTDGVVEYTFPEDKHLEQAA